MRHYIIQNKVIRKAKITYFLRHRIYNKHVQASEKAASSQKPAGLPVKCNHLSLLLSFTFTNIKFGNNYPPIQVSFMQFRLYST